MFYDALLRVLAVGAVFNTRGTRDVSRQHLRQLSGIASESLAHSHEQTIVTIGICFVVFRTIMLQILGFYSCFVCSIDRTVLFLAVCVRTDAIERDVSRVARQKTHFYFKMTDFKNKNLSTPGDVGEVCRSPGETGGALRWRHVEETVEVARVERRTFFHSE